MVGKPDRLTALKKPQKRVDRVVERVREYIFRNKLKPGDRLPSEHDLARQLDVSRSTLREAIKGLSVSGLLEARPRTGTRVREFSYDQVVESLVAHFHLSDVNLRDVLEARAALELSALPLVVKRATAKQIAKLRDTEVEFERATRANWNCHELDLKIHALLLEASGNKLLAGMVNLLRAFFSHPSFEESIVSRHFDRNEQELTMQEHRMIIQAVDDRDSVKAVEVMREHFDRQLRWLEQDEAEREKRNEKERVESDQQEDG